jgi:L-alanine-DL-glutamate epimerase-like enolase superfamily enzyme
MLLDLIQISSADASVDMALWDIKGKVLGVPIWELLGGKVRNKCEMYTHLQVTQHQVELRADCSGDGSFDERMERIKDIKKFGFTKVKCAVRLRLRCQSVENLTVATNKCSYHLV